MLVAGGRCPRVDVLAEQHLALERPVLDLHLLVDATVGALARAFAGDDQGALADGDRQAAGVDPGQLDDDGQLVADRRCGSCRRSGGTRAGAREARHLPELGEELLDLGVDARRGQLVAPRHAPNAIRSVASAAVLAWTRFVLRHRRLVVAFWAVVFVAGGFASTRLSAILSNSFSVPGTASEQVRDDLQAALRRALGRVVHPRLRARASGSPPAGLRRSLAAAVGRATLARPRRAAERVQPREDAGRQHGRLRRRRLDARTSPRRRATPTRSSPRSVTRPGSSTSTSPAPRRSSTTSTRSSTAT